MHTCVMRTHITQAHTLVKIWTPSRYDEAFYARCCCRQFSPSIPTHSAELDLVLVRHAHQHILRYSFTNCLHNIHIVCAQQQTFRLWSVHSPPTHSLSLPPLANGSFCRSTLGKLIFYIMFGSHTHPHTLVQKRWIFMYQHRTIPNFNKCMW